MELIEVIQVDFDNMENNSSAARMEKSLGTFGAATDNSGLSAHGMAGRFISKLNPRMYLGWNKEVYPQFRIKEHIVRTEG